jgi:hypothetical protein
MPISGRSAIGDRVGIWSAVFYDLFQAQRRSLEFVSDIDKPKRLGVCPLPDGIAFFGSYGTDPLRIEVKAEGHDAVVTFHSNWTRR